MVGRNRRPTHTRQTQGSLRTVGWATRCPRCSPHLCIIQKQPEKTKSSHFNQLSCQRTACKQAVETRANISGCPIQRQSEKQNSLVSCQVIFCWLDWLSGCLTLHNCLMLLSFPLRPAERSIFFSGKSVRLFDGARSATSSHAAKKGCGVRVVRAANLHVGVAFLLL